MADRTGIEWTDATWNPVTGCTEVSPGCEHCYAKTFAERFRGVPGHHFERGFDVQLRPERLGLPLRWRKPRRVFVNSMSDLWHEAVPDEFIAAVWVRMLWTSPQAAGYRQPGAPCHTYQVLTKRPGRMRSWGRRWGNPEQRAAWIATAVDRGWCHPRDEAEAARWPAVLSNVWLGVSVENQHWADIRVPALLETPAAVRWLSCEPLLGPVDLQAISTSEGPVDALVGNFDHVRQPDGSLTAMNNPRPLPGIDWVVVGGESGPGARPMHPKWARSLRDQCQRAGVPFLFKQWGEWAPTGQVGIGAIDPRERLVGAPDERGFREVIHRAGKRAAGRVLDGRTWDEFPDPHPGAVWIGGGG